MTDLKRFTLPVFLIYAGVIHAIGLAMLLPMIVTLPGPGSMIAPKDTPLAVELDAAAPDRDVTSALPVPAEPTRKAAAIDAARQLAAPEAGAEAKPDAPAAVANVGPAAAKPDAQAESVEDKPIAAAPKPKDKDNAASTDAKPAKSARKPVVQRNSKPGERRSVNKDTKIAPFGGGMSGLFTPGAPTKRR